MHGSPSVARSVCHSVCLSVEPIASSSRMQSQRKFKFGPLVLDHSKSNVRRHFEITRYKGHEA